MLTLNTLGALEMQGPGGAMQGIRRKTLWLLSYLARHAPRQVTRDQLCRLLWADRAAARARQSLRQELLGLKGLLGDRLVVDHEAVALRPGAVTLDVQRFEQEIGRGSYEAALALWGGEFLDGHEGAVGPAMAAWIESEREGARRQLALALRRLAHERSTTGHWRDAESFAARWAALCPHEEAAHVAWFQALSRSGNSTTALNRCEEFVERLRHDLGVGPSVVVRDLARRLQVEAASRRAPSSAGGASVSPPGCVERDAILAELADTWVRVSHGASAGVWLCGAPGMGRSRLCHELQTHVVHGGRAIVLAWSTRSPRPLVATWLDGLRHARGVAGASPEALAEVARCAPWIQAEFPALPPALAGIEALTAGVREVLESVAEEHPVLVTIDDVETADADGIEVLDLLLSRLPSRVMVVLTSAAGSRRAVERLIRTQGVTRYTLQPLSLGGVDAMLASMVHMSHEARLDLAARVHGATGGNPWYVSELVDTLVQYRWLVPEGPFGWQLDARAAAASMPVPITVRKHLHARLAALAVGDCVVLARLAHPVEPGVGEGPEAALSAEDASVQRLAEAGVLRLVPGRGDRWEVDDSMLRAVLASECVNAWRG